MSHKIKKLISIFLVLVMCCFSINVFALFEPSARVSENKVSDTLADKMEELGQEEGDLSVDKIPVWVWYKDINQKNGPGGDGANWTYTRKSCGSL